MNIKSYVYSLIILTLFITVFSFLIPKGKLGNTIKIAMSSIIIIAVFKPILNFGDNVFNNNTSLPEVNIQDGYVFYVGGLSIEEKEKVCDDILLNDGITGAKTQIEYTINNGILIDKVIILSDENIIVNEKTLKKISNYLNVDESLVVLYER